MCGISGSLSPIYLSKQIQWKILLTFLVELLFFLLTLLAFFLETRVLGEVSVESCLCGVGELGWLLLPQSLVQVSSPQPSADLKKRENS